MPTLPHTRSRPAPLLAAAVLAMLAPGLAQARTPHFSVLYTFTGGNDGAYPLGAPARAPSGDLYGTAQAGGAATGLDGAGTVFKLSATGQITVLHAFTGGADGGIPYGGVVLDRAGNAFGTTEADSAPNGHGMAAGTVFKIDAAGNETVLHTFDPTVRKSPIGPDDVLVRGRGGSYYDTTFASNGGQGALFRISPAGALKVLHQFSTPALGTVPYATVTFDSAGNLYGTTDTGGAANLGVVYKLDTLGAYTVLHSFGGGADGAHPSSKMLIDSAGNLYGTTDGGDVATDYGTIFKLAPDGTETVLYNFQGGADGAGSIGPLLAGPGGIFYGTTSAGGASGDGTLFKLDAAGTKTILHNFSKAADGSSPLGGLSTDRAGALYGTAELGGGAGYGTVFRFGP